MLSSGLLLLAFYDLRLAIDEEWTDLEFGRGNGGGVDEDTQTLQWAGDARAGE